MKRFSILAVIGAAYLLGAAPGWRGEIRVERIVFVDERGKEVKAVGYKDFAAVAHARPAPTPVPGRVYATPSGTKYHLSTCRWARTADKSMKAGTAQEKGLEACKVCKPNEAEKEDAQ